jgi:YHS domain-containing protein
LALARRLRIHGAVSKRLVLLFALGVAACSSSSSSASQSSSSSQAVAALPAGMTRVSDPSQVCMVNNQFIGKPQIPIAVAGRTYYGCCAMCKDRLGNDPSSRTAQDPVTGEKVDKSTAVIIQDSTGKVMYFASEDTLRRYRG